MRTSDSCGPFSLRHLRRRSPPTESQRSRCLREGPRANRLRRPPSGRFAGNDRFAILNTERPASLIEDLASLDCWRTRSSSHALSPACSLQARSCRQDDGNTRPSCRSHTPSYKACRRREHVRADRSSHVSIPTRSAPTIRLSEVDESCISLP